MGMKINILDENGKPCQVYNATDKTTLDSNLVKFLEGHGTCYSIELVDCPKMLFTYLIATLDEWPKHLVNPAEVIEYDDASTFFHLQNDDDDDEENGDEDEDEEDDFDEDEDEEDDFDEDEDDEDEDEDDEDEDDEDEDDDLLGEDEEDEEDDED